MEISNFIRQEMEIEVMRLKSNNVGALSLSYKLLKYIVSPLPALPPTLQLLEFHNSFSTEHNKFPDALQARNWFRVISLITNLATLIRCKFGH